MTTMISVSGMNIGISIKNVSGMNIGISIKNEAGT